MIDLVMCLFEQLDPEGRQAVRRAILADLPGPARTARAVFPHYVANGVKT